MIDLSQFATVGGLAVLLGLIVQGLRPVLPASARPYFPWIAAGIGIALAELFGLARGQTGGQVIAQLAVTGFLAGFAATGLYQATVGLVRARAARPMQNPYRQPPP